MVGQFFQDQLEAWVFGVPRVPVHVKEALNILNLAQENPALHLRNSD